LNNDENEINEMHQGKDTKDNLIIILT